MLSVILLISILLGLIPLAGIVWIFLSGTISTVDGLFGILILLSLSGIFFLNALWEWREPPSGLSANDLALLVQKQAQWE